MLEIIISVMWLIMNIHLQLKYLELRDFNWIIIKNTLMGNTSHLLS